MIRSLLLGLALLPVFSLATPAAAQQVPGFATVERIYPVGERGTAWKRKCFRHAVSPDSKRSGFYDRQDRYVVDRPEPFIKGRRHCTQVPVASGRFVGYRARVIEGGRIFDQFVNQDVRPGDRVSLSPQAQFVGYDLHAHRHRPQQDWGDRYFPGYPYAERY